MKFDFKVRLVSGFFLVFFAFILIKLFFLQVLSAQKYAALADGQHFYTLEIPARRGEIFSNDGFSLASDKNDYLFYADLLKLKENKTLVSEKIAGILAEDKPIIATIEAKIILNKLSVENAVWVNIQHFVNKNSKEKIEKLNIPGLGFIDEESRDYPESSMAAHLLGFVGFDTVGNPKGYFGLEGFYERELSGKSGELRIEKDALGRPIAIGTETRREQLNGRSLVTTIDRSVQKFTEYNLSEGIKTWQASGGTAIVMNPKTGEILAMANFPVYDPKNYAYYPDELYKNPAVANLYEPGSIMKPLVIAAAINENKVTPETRCNVCDGPRKIGDAFIHTFNDQYFPNLTIAETLINSDNTGMVFVGEKLGYDKLYSYFNKYGFGQKTGIDLQDEETGGLKNFKDLYEVDKATLTFGQGMNLNAVQMMKAWSILANEGKMPTPHLVSKIMDGDKIITLNWPQSEEIISKNTAKTVTEILVRVARESPTKFPLERIPQLNNFKMAVKSGTAQIAAKGKYKDQKTTASVIGYFPADNPRFLVMVKLDEPSLRIWGSDTAGPIFATIARDLVYYYGISP